MLGVGLDELVQRDTTRRHRQMAWLAAASLGGMAVTSTLAVTAIQARDEARDQRKEAEGLVAFMLGDLKDKLEPIGRLDALDGVGSRVLAYYKNQDAAELTDAALLQRSRALSLMAEVAANRGDLSTAYALYREAALGTAEAVRRNPDDPQRLYDQAQNAFAFADIALRRGQTTNAEGAFREYKRLADKMVAIEPDNMKWRMEVQNADANLAVVLTAQRRFPEAAAQWAQAFRMIEALTTADPTNRDYQQSLAESLAWYADAEKDAGNLKRATELREQDVALLTRLMSDRHGDVSWRQKLIPAERGLANLYAFQSRMPEALTHMRAAVATGDQLTSVEPDNSKWLAFAAKAKTNLAELLLLTGAANEAAQFNEWACNTIAGVLRKDSTVQDWRGILRDCWLNRAQIAAVRGNSASALTSGDRAIDVAKTIKNTDPTLDRFNLAKAYRVVGDIQRANGNSNGAKVAWQAGLSLIPPGIAERPAEAQIHIELLDRLGRSAEARPLRQQLERAGYKYPTLRIG
jgi:tetratricopeptide (TPR) repeat protein